MITEIFTLKSKIVLRSLLIKDFKSLVRFLTFLFVIATFLLGTYFVFFKVFNYLLNLEDIGRGFIYRISSLLFTIIFFLLFTSSIITSISTFFRTPELEFLFSTPLKTEHIFLSKLVENGFYASWASLIISLPLIFSIAKVFNVESIYLIKWLILFVGMLFVSTSFGIFVVFLISDLFKRFSLNFLISLIFIILISFFIFFFIFVKPDVFNLPRNATLEEVTKYLNSLEVEQFKYLPSGLVLQIIFNDINAKSSFFQYVYLLIYIVFTMIFLLFIIKVYRKKYLGFSLLNLSTKKKRNMMLENEYLSKNLEIFLIVKDMIIFFRDPSQWGQSLIFMILLFIYSFSIVRSPIYFKTPFYTYILSFANLGFSSYIMATLSVRFIYPLISLEGKTFSIIKSSIKLERYFNSKLIFNFLIIFFLGEFLIVMTNIFLKMDLLIIILSTIITFIFSFGITIINTGFGAILPDFNEKNPSKIASGFGGIVSAIVSLFYVGVSLSFLSTPVKNYFESSFRNLPFDIKEFYFSLFFIVVFTFIMFIIIYIFALKRLKKYNL
ncbi:MAG: hypothetical protein ABIN00_05140 [candidate division WOR-3 bacterium]